VQPGKVHEIIALVLDIVKDGRRSGVNRNLIVVAPRGGNQSELVRGILIKDEGRKSA
jgi:hypothetical protein